MKRAIMLVAAMTGCMQFAARSQAGGPVAIVEEIYAGDVSVRYMDYVESGRVIQLGTGGRLSLGYLKTCFRESIVGGRVIVGTGQSTVDGGNIYRVRVECDGGKLDLFGNEPGKSGVLVVRNLGVKQQGVSPIPSFRIFGRSPMVKVTNGATSVAFFRLDAPAKRLEISVARRIADLWMLDEVLVAGAIYQATAGRKSVVFKVARQARLGPGPIIGRLIHF